MTIKQILSLLFFGIAPFLIAQNQKHTFVDFVPNLEVKNNLVTKVFDSFKGYKFLEVRENMVIQMQINIKNQTEYIQVEVLNFNNFLDFNKKRLHLFKGVWSYQNNKVFVFGEIDSFFKLNRSQDFFDIEKEVKKKVKAKTKVPPPPSVFCVSSLLFTIQGDSIINREVIW